MSSNNGATSTIAALCYATQPEIDFKSLVDELGQALKSATGFQSRSCGIYEDIAIFDLSTVRIGLALCDFERDDGTLPPSHGFASSLVISVGSSIGQPGSGALFENRVQVRDGLIEKVEAHHPADVVLKLELDDVFTEDLFDGLMERLWPQSDLDPCRTDQTDLIRQALPIVVSTCARHARPEALLADLERKFDEHMQRQHPIKPADAPANIDTRPKPVRAVLDHAPGTRPATPPRLPREQSENARIRLALYPVEPEEPVKTAQPTPRRMAIYAINSTVLVFSLPVGAALMTYNMLGRESLSATSRGMAVTGLLMGIGNSAAAQQLLAGLT